MHREHKNKSVENQPRHFHPMPAKRRERGLAAHLARFGACSRSVTFDSAQCCSRIVSSPSSSKP
jgi:hypothetical protein